MPYNLTVSGNEITDPSRQAALAWALGQQGGSTDGSGLYRNIAWLAFQADPIGAGQLLNANGQVLLRTSLGGGKYRLTNSWGDGFPRILRVSVLLADLQSNAPYTCSFSYENVTATGAESDWCDVPPNNMIPVGSSGRLVFTASRAYDSTFRFMDVQVPDGGSIDLWSLQVEDGTVVHPYVAGYGIQPGQGIAVWEAGTNLQRQGQCAALVDWQLLSGSTVTLDATTPAPFSPQSVKAACPGTISGEGVWAFTALGQAAPAGTVGVGSIWVKATAGTVLYSYVRWGLTDATTAQGTSVIWTATGNWQLITPPPVAVTAAKVGDQLGIFARTNVAAVASIWAAHAMLQSGPTVASPYIATSAGVTASRAAARVQAPSYLLDETQAWVALRVRLGFPSTGAPPINGLFSFADSNNTRLVCYIQGNGTLLFARQSAGAGASISAAPVYNAGDALTIVCAWQAALQKISVNGVAFTSGANSNIPVLAAASFDIGSLDPYFAASELDGAILWLATGLGVLSDADAAALAALPGTPTGANFPAAAQLSSLMAMTTPTYAPIVDVSQNRRAQSNYSSLKALGYSDEMATAVASRIAA